LNIFPLNQEESKNVCSHDLYSSVCLGSSLCNKARNFRKSSDWKGRSKTGLFVEDIVIYVEILIGYKKDP
jgi:hypothetical protein